MLPVHWPCIKIVARIVLNYHRKLYGSSSADGGASDGSGSGVRERSNTYGKSAAKPATPSAPIPLKGAPAAPATPSAATSRDLQSSAAAPKTPKQPANLTQFPWIIPPAENQAMLSEVRAQLVDEGVLAILTSNAARASASSAPAGYGPSSQWDSPGGCDAEDSNQGENVGQPSASSAECAGNGAIMSIATSYMRIWLSLREIEFKDPHPKVARAIGAVVGYVHAQVNVYSVYVLLNYRFHFPIQIGLDDAAASNGRHSPPLQDEDTDPHWALQSEQNPFVSTPSRNGESRAWDPADTGNFNGSKLTISTAGITTDYSASSPMGSPCLPPLHGRGGSQGDMTSWMLLSGGADNVAGSRASDSALRSHIYDWSRCYSSVFINHDFVILF